MSKEVVTLYIDDASIRLLVASGKKIKKWAESPLEPGLVKGSVILKEAEVAAKVRQLFDVQQVKARKVVLGFSGLHSMTRPLTLPNLPRAMMTEAVARTAKKLLPIPVEQLYLSWQYAHSADGKGQAFVVGVPRKSVDTLITTLRKAGLQLSHMAIKPLVLTAPIKKKTAIMLDVQPNEFDVIIMQNQVPQPVRTVSLPAEAVSWQEKLPLIISDLDRTIKFFNSNNQQSPLDSSVPIYVSGELATLPEPQKAVSEAVGHPVVALPSPMESPAKMDINRYMVNIALAFQELGGRELRTSVARLNVLPAAYQPKPLSLMRIAAAPIVAVLVLTMVALVMLMQTGSTDINSMNGEIAAANSLMKQRQTEQQELRKNITELEKSNASAKASSNALSLAFSALEKRREEVNGNLKTGLKISPENVSLNSIKQVDNKLTISGTASSEDEVLLYARNLDLSGRFSETIITGMKRAGEKVEFSLSLKAKE